MSDRLSEERAVGRLEGQVSALEARMLRLEETTNTQLGQMNGKLDAITITLANHTAGRAIWRWIINAGIAASGWGAVGFAWASHHFGW